MVARLRDELKRLKLLELEFADNMIGTEPPEAPKPGAGTAGAAAENRRGRR